MNRTQTVYAETATLRNRALALSDIGDEELQIFRRSAREEVNRARIAYDNAISSLRSVEYFEHAVDLECERRGI